MDGFQVVIHVTLQVVSTLPIHSTLTSSVLLNFSDRREIHTDRGRVGKNPGFLEEKKPNPSGFFGFLFLKKNFHDFIGFFGGIFDLKFSSLSILSI